MQRKWDQTNSRDKKVYTYWVQDMPWSFNGSCQGPTKDPTWPFIYSSFEVQPIKWSTIKGLTCTYVNQQWKLGPSVCLSDTGSLYRGFEILLSETNMRLFLGSMLPQYMALSVLFRSFVSQKKTKHKICAQVRKFAQNQDLLSIFQIYFQFEKDVINISRFGKITKEYNDLKN